MSYTDPYFDNANEIQSFPTGIIVQAEGDKTAWEPWVPYEDGDEPPEQTKQWNKARMYEGRWHYCVGVMPWWFAKNSL